VGVKIPWSSIGLWYLNAEKKKKTRPGQWFKKNQGLKYLGDFSDSRIQGSGL